MKPRIFADYHTHTRYSHGTGTVEENVLAAIDCGLSVIGIADHGPGQIAHGVRLSALRRQMDEIAALKEKYAGKIRIFSCVEADITGMDGTLDLPDSFDGLDRLLAGYHRTAIPREKTDLFRLQIPGLLFPRAVSGRMTEAVEHALSGGRMMALTHPGEYIPVDMTRVALAAKKAGVLIEINNKHPMAQADLKKAVLAGAEFLLSSDAHRPEDVGNVERAYAAAMEAGVSRDAIVNLTNAD